MFEGGTTAGTAVDPAIGNVGLPRGTRSDEHYGAGTVRSSGVKRPRPSGGVEVIKSGGNFVQLQSRVFCRQPRQGVAQSKTSESPGATSAGRA
ncbi:hypothetical protein MES4922_20192 [Mesorhizobium ventifaucium]|uniref:Uncharacterized protein n=1 Tax=Mesorhizobium ventifaucium TaxID=666020 RepID=A0ABN8JKP7_9HYPH|nr:hypothetical protein MES4922_20192 [Mesorhizobium ventifaucium]